MSLQTSLDARPDLYESVADLETPALILDLDVLDRNLAEYTALASEHDVSLRTHMKTTKIPDLAHYVLEETGDGIICQTLGETEVMAASGIDDIYDYSMVVTETKLDHLLRVAEKVDHFETNVSGPEHVERFERAAANRDQRLGIVLEIDTGGGRFGVDPGQPAVEVAAQIHEADHLDLTALKTFEAHVKQDPDVETPDEYERACFAAMDEMRRTKDGIEDAGIAVETVKAGQSATVRYTAKHPVVTEINPGKFLVNDISELSFTSYDLDEEDCALSVLSTVIAKPSADRVMVDAGRKALVSHQTDTSEVAAADQRARPRHRTGVHYLQGYEEQGIVDVSNADDEIEVGDVIEFIPTTAHTTLNLHDTLIGVRDEQVVDVWDVQARGKVK